MLCSGKKEALEELHLPSDDDQASMLSSASGPELLPDVPSDLEWVPPDDVVHMPKGLRRCLINNS